MSFRWAQIHITSWVFRPTSEMDQFYDSSNSKTLGVILQEPRVVEYSLYPVLAAELRGTLLCQVVSGQIIYQSGCVSG